MGRIGNPLLLLLTASSLLCGCSVKEDRSVCPCHTIVNIDEFIRIGFSDAVISFSAGELVYRDAIDLTPYKDVGFEQELPRGMNRAAVAAGVRNGMLKDDTLKVAAGKQADGLWIFAQEFVCDGEEMLIRAVPHKQFCKLTIIVPEVQQGGGWPYNFRLSASCNAIGLYSLSPVDGEYRAAGSPQERGVWTMNIPRQKENSLLLEVYEPDRYYPLEGPAAYSVDLGSKFEQEGYDWSLEDLPDVEVTLDKATGEMSLHIAEWDEDEHRNLVI